MLIDMSKYCRRRKPAHLHELKLRSGCGRSVMGRQVQLPAISGPLDHCRQAVTRALRVSNGQGLNAPVSLAHVLVEPHVALAGNDRNPIGTSS